MKVFRKITAGIFFIIFFLLFLIIGTLKFEVLNSEFMLSSLERNGVYTNLPLEFSRALANDPNLPEEEKEAYAKIVSLVPSSKMQNLLEKNLSAVLGFLNGNSKDINLFIPAGDLGIMGAGDINWSLTQNPPQETVEKFQMANGLGNKLLLVLIALAAVLVLLFMAAGRSVLLITGILTLLLGGIGRLLLLVISSNTPPKAEPSQVLLGLLSSSILADITLSWLILGAVFIVIWFFLKKHNKFS